MTESNFIPDRTVLCATNIAIMIFFIVISTTIVVAIIIIAGDTHSCFGRYRLISIIYICILVFVDAWMCLCVSACVYVWMALIVYWILRSHIWPHIYQITTNIHIPPSSALHWTTTTANKKKTTLTQQMCAPIRQTINQIEEPTNDREKSEKNMLIIIRRFGYKFCFKCVCLSAWLAILSMFGIHRASMTIERRRRQKEKKIQRTSSWKPLEARNDSLRNRPE